MGPGATEGARVTVGARVTDAGLLGGGKRRATARGLCDGSTDRRVCGRGGNALSLPQVAHAGPDGPWKELAR